MKRFFTIVEGEGQGTTKPLVAPLMILGRSKNADFNIEDPLISRRHLEVRVDQDAVFIEDKSSHGSTLNGKPLAGVVSLNPGDIIELGHTKLRYDEVDDDPPSSAAQPSAEAPSSAMEGTRVAGTSDAGWGGQEDAEPKADATRAVASDGTRMLPEGQLGPWQAAKPEDKASGKSGWLGVTLLILAVVIGAGFWFLKNQEQQPVAGTTAFRDELFGFSLEYPAAWAQTSENKDVISFVSGRDGARVNLYVERQTQHALTGLTNGFKEYEEVLKKHFEKFEMGVYSEVPINNFTAMGFGFSTPTTQGKGIYLLNAETRIVVECSSPRQSYGQYRTVFGDILESFRLEGPEQQQFIDFPLPDAAMRELALANPGELARQVDEHIRLADALRRTKDVRPENLYRATQEYRAALQLAIAPPKRLDSYGSAAQGLRESTKLFNKALDQMRLAIRSAQSQRDTEAVYWTAHRMMQMVDKQHPVYNEAYIILKSVRPP